MKIKLPLIALLFLSTTVALFGQPNGDPASDLELGLKAFEQKDYDAAKYHLLEAANYTNFSVQAFFALGQVALENNDIKSAQDFFKNTHKYNDKYSLGYSTATLHQDIAKVYKHYQYLKKEQQHLKLAQYFDDKLTNKKDS